MCKLPKPIGLLQTTRETVNHLPVGAQHVREFPQIFIIGDRLQVDFNNFSPKDRSVSGIIRLMASRSPQDRQQSSQPRQQHSHKLLLRTVINPSLIVFANQLPKPNPMSTIYPSPVCILNPKRPPHSFKLKSDCPNICPRGEEIDEMILFLVH
jgi:hypothetical protein